MLARITGTLESLAGQSALIVPDGQPGLAHEALLPAYLADRLTRSGDVGESITLHTLEYFESQNQGASFLPRLLGFASVREREFFELLTTVKGLGNKRAMRAMAVEPARIARAIAERDARFLQTLPEIGPKLAELIVHELKSKCDRFVMSADEAAAMDAAAGAKASPASVEPKTPKTKKPAVNGTGAKGHGQDARATAANPPVRQTVDALVALGESPIDAERMVARAIDRARAAGGEVPMTPDELLTAAYATR